MSTARAQALRALIDYRLPVEQTLAQLAAFGWDAEEPLVWLTSADVEALLARYASGELSPDQVTDWADLIECREDIGVAAADAYLSEIIFRLANPNLNEPVTPELVAEIQDEILRARAV